MSQPPAPQPSSPKPPASVRRPRPAATPDTGGRGALGRAFQAVSGVARDRARSTHDILGEAAKALTTPAGVVGAAIEVAWVSTHLALYPFGLFGRPDAYDGHRYSLGELPPVQRGLVIGNVEAAATPILLVHGMVDNRSVFALLRRGLRRRGFGRVVSINYSPWLSLIHISEPTRLGMIS